MGKIRINQLNKKPSLTDGPGYRTVLFLQGCNLKCKGCHNKSTWNFSGGFEIDIDELVKEIEKICFNKKITISGGEPLLQIESLRELLNKISDFDICLYTGFEFKNVPRDILKYLNYIKVGPFVKEKFSSEIPYVGSSNQKFIFLKKGER